MKNLLKNGMLTSVILMSGNVMAQCPGTINPDVTPTVMDYTIDISDINCNSNGDISVSVAGDIPSDAIFYWVVNGIATITPFTDINMPTPEAGIYTYIALTPSNGGVDICTFEINDTRTCKGDYNGNGIIDASDYVNFLNQFGSSCEDCCGDFDGNGIVTAADLSSFLSVWGTSCTTTMMPETTEANNSEVVKSLIGEITKMNEASILTYPNPTNDFITISIPNVILDEHTTDLQILDISGKVIKTESNRFYENSIKTNVSQLDPGTYYVILSTEKNIYSTNFIVK